MNRILEFLGVNVVFPIVLGFGAWLIGIAAFAEAMKVTAAVFVGAALGEILTRVYGRVRST